MKISIINGSPKPGRSTSQQMIDYLIPELNGHETTVYNINKAPLTETQRTCAVSCDALIFAFPLYIDSIPSHLLAQMIELEKQSFRNKNAHVYCIVNNGFYEGKQNRIAIEQMKHWCVAAGFSWGQAVGSGAGEMLPFTASIPLGHGPNKNLGLALKELTRHILSSEGGDDLFISPNWPRFLWKINASALVWYPRAKANGLKRKQLLRQIHKA